MNFSDAELERYARHIVLPEIGGAGQAALKAARVLVVGAGGIGSPALQYLAAAGIGLIAVADDDEVSLSNLQRQTIYGTEDIGKRKVSVAKARAHAINPHPEVYGLFYRLDAKTLDTTIPDFDVILDGTDNFDTRLLVADAALRHRIPLVSAAVGRFEGQLGVFRGWEADKPCYRCFVGADPETAGINCSEQGVLGALTGIMGSLAALEVIRAIHPFGEDSAGKLLLADTLALRFRTLTLPKDPGVPRMRGLTLIVATGDVERFRAALALACAHAALGGQARVYAHEKAVPMLVPGADPDDAALPAHGFATRAQLLAEAHQAGVRLIACQTGLAAAGLSFEALAAGTEPGGLISLMADLGDDRLVAF